MFFWTLFLVSLIGFSRFYLAINSCTVRRIKQRIPKINSYSIYQCNKSFESSELKKGMINSFVRFVCGYTTGLLNDSFQTRILCKLYFWAVVVAMFVCRSMQGWLAACSVLFSVLSDSVLKWQNHVSTKKLPNSFLNWFECYFQI